MGNEWPLVKIEDIQAQKKGAIAIGPFGSRMKSDCYVSIGIPVIRGTNIDSGSIFKGNFVYISKEKADSLGSCNVFKNDLVFPHRGSIGEVGIVEGDAKYVISSSLMKLTVDEKKVNPKFLYYFFKSEIGKHELLKNASQVGTPGIGQPLTSLKSIEYRNPPIAIQNKIEEIISSLDSKIQLNRETNQTLEAMAQALFKSWFVDFDPVFDNIIAHNLAHNNAPLHNIPEPLLPHAQRRLNVHNVGRGSARQTASQEFHHLFPQAFEQSDEPSVGIQGWVPKGWGVDGLGSFINFSNGKLMKSTVDGLYPLYGANGIIGKTNEIRCSNAIIIGRVGAYCGAIKYCPSSFWPSDNTIVASSTESEDMLPFILYQLKYLNLNQYAGGAAQPLLNQATLKSIKVSAPSRSACNVFNKTVSEFIIKSTNLENEIHVLESLRDTLLPKLISGELRIPDAVQASEALAK